MTMWEFFKQVLGKTNKEQQSRNQARERLRLVLVHDRATISPVLMDKLKSDVLETVSTYMIVDESEKMARFGLEQREREVCLVARIPVRQIRRNYAEHIL